MAMETDSSTYLHDSVIMAVWAWLWKLTRVRIFMIAVSPAKAGCCGLRCHGKHQFYFHQLWELRYSTKNKRHTPWFLSILFFPHLVTRKIAESALAVTSNPGVDRCSDHDFHAVKPRCQISFQIWVDRTGKSDHLIPQKCFDQMTLAYLSPNLSGPHCKVFTFWYSSLRQSFMIEIIEGPPRKHS